MKIGVDFGGVLTETTTPPTRGYLEIPPRPHGLETIRAWRAEGHEPFLVSKADSEEKIFKARHWLSHYQFDRAFGESNLNFCENQEGKIRVCQENQIDVMIDDTVRQLELLGGVVLHRVLFAAAEAPRNMLHAEDWPATKKLVEQLDLGRHHVV